MYLIVGLGNPEEEYSKTRHNMGFNTINEIAKMYNIKVNKKNCKALMGKGKIEKEEVILLKPQTYMNLSGEAVIQCIKSYKIDIENLIVIYDDMDIEPGKIKILKKGGAGSHNGMKSIVENIKTKEFKRVRIGIGKPKYATDKINYVLGAIPKEEMKKLEEGVNLAKEATIDILKIGIENAMTKYNTNKDGKE